MGNNKEQQQAAMTPSSTSLPAAATASSSSSLSSATATAAAVVANENEKQMVGGCCVCADDTGYDDNLLVYCDGDGCEVAVHQLCYGVGKVPDGDWYCRRCEFKLQSASAGAAKTDATCSTKLCCQICPQKLGALKRTDTGKWAHIICALYIPEITFGNIRTMEPIITKDIKPERFSKKCSICELGSSNGSSSGGLPPDALCSDTNDSNTTSSDSTAAFKNDQTASSATASSQYACVNCSKAGCKHWFHVTCAQAAGLLCETNSNNAAVPAYCIYCKKHFPKQSNSGVKRIPAFKLESARHEATDAEGTDTAAARAPSAEAKSSSGLAKETLKRKKSSSNLVKEPGVENPAKKSSARLSLASSSTPSLSNGTIVKSNTATAGLALTIDSTIVHSNSDSNLLPAKSKAKSKALDSSSTKPAASKLTSPTPAGNKPATTARSSSNRSTKSTDTASKASSAQPAESKPKEQASSCGAAAPSTSSGQVKAQKPSRKSTHSADTTISAPNPDTSVPAQEVKPEPAELAPPAPSDSKQIESTSTATTSATSSSIDSAIASVLSINTKSSLEPEKAPSASHSSEMPALATNSSINIVLQQQQSNDSGISSMSSTASLSLQSSGPSPSEEKPVLLPFAVASPLVIPTTETKPSTSTAHMALHVETSKENSSMKRKLRGNSSAQDDPTSESKGPTASPSSSKRARKQSKQDAVVVSSQGTTATAAVNEETPLLKSAGGGKSSTTGAKEQLLKLAKKPSDSRSTGRRDHEMNEEEEEEENSDGDGETTSFISNRDTFEDLLYKQFDMGHQVMSSMLQRSKSHVDVASLLKLIDDGKNEQRLLEKHLKALDERHAHLTYIHNRLSNVSVENGVVVEATKSEKTPSTKQATTSSSSSSSSSKMAANHQNHVTNYNDAMTGQQHLPSGFAANERCNSREISRTPSNHSAALNFSSQFSNQTPTAAAATATPAVPTSASNGSPSKQQQLSTNLLMPTTSPISPSSNSNTPSSTLINFLARTQQHANSNNSNGNGIQMSPNLANANNGFNPNVTQHLFNSLNLNSMLSAAAAAAAANSSSNHMNHHSLLNTSTPGLANSKSQPSSAAIAEILQQLNSTAAIPTPPPSSAPASTTPGPTHGGGHSGQSSSSSSSSASNEFNSNHQTAHHLHHSQQHGANLLPKQLIFNGSSAQPSIFQSFNQLNPYFLSYCLQNSASSHQTTTSAPLVTNSNMSKNHDNGASRATDPSASSSKATTTSQV